MTDAIDEHGAKEVVDDAPMKRMGHADDLAGIRHLPRLEGQAVFVCGAVIPVDAVLQQPPE